MDIAQQPRETHILRRGDYSQPTEKVTPNTPAVLPPLPPGAPANRLGLAEWVTMRDNPLTARVEVNRLWQTFFGAGIVATPADFGAQGAYPTHPELLDWLAVDFMDHNWDIKRLAKKIVMSATYRQSSSHVDASLRDANASLGETRPRDPDPQNRLLSRGPSFRLPAEFIRDSALKISGLLVDRLGGPSVNPYTPGDLWREVSHYGSTPATAQTFVQDHGEKLYRRSLYTFWKRTVPPPNMVAFDAPSRETCTVYRAATTTPLQALVLAQRRPIRRSLARVCRTHHCPLDRRNRKPPLGVRRMHVATTHERRAQRVNQYTRPRTRPLQRQANCRPKIPRQRRITPQQKNPRPRTRRVVPSRGAAAKPERNHHTKLEQCQPNHGGKINIRT